MVRVTTTQAGQVTLRDLILPHGSYQVMLLHHRQHSQVTTPSPPSPSPPDMIVRKHHFVVPTERRRERVHVRTRRHKHPQVKSPNVRVTLPTRDLILTGLAKEEERDEEEREEEHTPNITTNSSSSSSSGGGGGGDTERGGVCVCCKCFKFVLGYNNETAVLTFDYHLNATCNDACSRVNVQLYRDWQSVSTTHYETEKPHLLLDAERIGQDKNRTKGPVHYSNIDTGCYFVELKPQLYPLPERTLPLCVTPAITVTNMEEWNTFFSLEPNPQRRSLTVRWTVSEQYNFSCYHLTLHHHPSLRINCTGTAIYPNMTIIPQDRLLVKQSLFTFHNLSSGWYCARVTPLDDRCPLDGCRVLSSPPQQLTEPVEWKCGDGGDGDDGCENKSVWRLTLLVVGCVMGAVVTGVMLAWAILHTWPTISQMFTSAAHYSPVPIRPSVTNKSGSGGRKQIVLLVWTPQGPHGTHFGPIIAAFKTLLRTYSHCEVYDYLDLSSLPERQQLHLLASPTTWLDSILAQHSIKIIIVATEGACQRQVEWKKPVPTLHRTSVDLLPPVSHNAHDHLLFPYLLRRLHDQPQLAGDYSRIFHIRFSEVSHSAVELGNVVSWKRYKIPEHLRSLTISLHGGVGGGTFEEPTDNHLKELRAALFSHPQYCSRVSNGTIATPWPRIVVSNGTTPATLTNGTCPNGTISATLSNGTVKT